MKKVVVFYSWSGKTEKLAKAYAEETDAYLYEIKDKRKPGTIRAYTAGCFSAMGMKQTPTLPLMAPMEEYERITIMAPVWAGHPAPAINSVFASLPEGREVEVLMVSASGSSSCREKVEVLVRSKGCTLVKFENIKG